MGTNYIAPIWRMPRNANKDKLSNYSIDFSGSNAFVNCGNTTELNGASKLTFNLWIKYDSTLNFQVFLGRNITSSATDVFQFYNWGSGYLYFWLKSAGVGSASYVSNFSSLVNIDEWHMLTAVYDGTQSSNNDRLSIYLDGGSTNIITNYGTIPTTFPNITDDFLIGKGISGDFNGKLSQISIFDYNLDSSQITYLYNLNNPMVISGAEPVAYWPLGDNSNPNATAGYPNISVGADSVFDFESGDVNFIKAFDVPVTTFTEASFSAWVNFEDVAGTYEYIMGMGSGPGNFMSISKFQTSGPFYTYDGTGAKQCAISPVSNRWYHVVVTQTGTVRRFYIDGVEDANSPFTCPALAIPYDNLTIGAYNNQPPASTPASPLYRLDGQLSNVQVWDKKIEQADVTTLYNNGQPLMTGTQPQEANLQAWYKLNQSANWEADTAGNWQIPDAVSSYPQSFKVSSSDSIDFSNGLLSDLSAFTISFWYNRGAINSTTATLLKQDGVITISQYRQSASYSGLQIVLTTVNGQSSILSTSQGNVPTGEWLHVGIVYDGSNMTLYRNGTQAPGTYNPVAATGNTVNNNNVFEIFSQSLLQYGISNLQVWDTNLSATGSNSIETLYNNGSPLTTAIASDNLKLWAKLDNNEKFDGTNWEVENQAYPANYENALNFGTRSQAEYIALNQLPLYNAITVSAWIKTQKNGSSRQTIISNSQPNAIANEKGWQLAIDQAWSSGYTKAGFVFYDSTGSTAITIAQTSSQDLTDNKWHHVVALWDGTTNTNAAKIFVDGLLAGQGTSSFAGPISQPVIGLEPRIGSQAYSTSGGGNYFGGDGGEDGFISNVQTWDSSLTYGTVSSIGDTAGGQIADLYNNGTPVTTAIDETNIQCWYKLDNLTTGIQDLSNNSNNGTNNGTSQASTFVSTEAGISSGMTEQNLVNNNVSVLNGESSGMNTTNLVQSNLNRTQPYSNYSFNFDSASSDYIEVPNNDSFNFVNTNFSISIWLNPDVTHSGLVLTHYYGSDGWGVYNQNGSIRFYDAPVWTTLTTINNSEWTHILIVGDYTGSNLICYKNGIEVYNSSHTFSITDANINLFIASERGTGFFYDGKISNTCLFDRALTEQEALKIYNNGVPQDLQATSSFSNNIIAWWPMDEHSSYYDGTDWVVRDIENGNDGDGANTGNVDDLVGNAPGSEASGTGTNLTIADLIGDMYESKINAHSINMADYADGVTNPANSGRSTEVPSV